MFPGTKDICAASGLSVLERNCMIKSPDSQSTLGHLCLLDFRVCVQELLDFSRIDIFSSTDNHVFDTSLYPAVAKLVQTGNIPVGNGIS